MPDSTGLVQVSDVPVIDVNCGALDGAVDDLRGKAKNFTSKAQDMADNWQVLPSVFVADGVLDEIYSAMGVIAANVEQYCDLIQGGARVLEDFSSTVSESGDGE